MEKTIEKLYGKEMIEAINQSLDEYKKLGLDDKEILNIIKDYSESIRECMYLISLDRKEDKLSFMINKANQILALQSVSTFEKKYEEGKAEEYLLGLNKMDKIALLSNLHLNVSKDELNKKEPKEIDYYHLIEQSIKIEQKNKKKKNGLDRFISDNK